MAAHCLHTALDPWSASPSRTVDPGRRLNDDDEGAPCLDDRVTPLQSAPAWRASCHQVVRVRRETGWVQARRTGAGATREGDVEAQIDRKQTRTYERAIERLVVIRMLHERGGDPSGFETYLADLRHRHGQKTTFIRLLDEAGLR